MINFINLFIKLGLTTLLLVVLGSRKNTGDLRVLKRSCVRYQAMDHNHVWPYNLYRIHQSGLGFMADK